MKPSLEKLQKFFKLEIEQNYSNRAVIGGLDRILSGWEADARLDGLSEDAIRAVGICLREYNGLNPAQRLVSLDALWQHLRDLCDEDLPSLPAPPLTLPGQESPPKVQNPPSRARKPRPQPDETNTREVEPFANPQKAYVAKPPAPDGPPAALSASVTVLSGVGGNYAAALARLDIHNLGDMLYFLPRRYDDYSTFKPINRLQYGEDVTVIGVLKSVATRKLSGNRSMTEAVVADGSGALRLTFWNPYIAKRLRPGLGVALSGKVEQYLGRLVMTNPEVEELEQENLSTNRVVPVYPLTAGITQRWLRKKMHEVVGYWAPRLRDSLPEDIRQSAGLLPLSTALGQAHFPDSFEILKDARHRLAFDEIFLLQLGVLRQKQAWQERSGRSYDTSEDWLAAQLARLPFGLTGAQERALADVRVDLASGVPMNRLLQGDVGSGKTIVAVMAMAMLARHGSQSAIMAPTGILAEQHLHSLQVLLCQGEDAPLQAGQVRLLVGSTPAGERQEILAGLADGSIKILVGTHALLEDPVTFADLQLAVIDEQHRFGVKQRAILRSKGENPHLLVMTATPIPRSLALTVYGDLELSVMDEMPPGRQTVNTQVFFPAERERAYQLIRSQIDAGHQAFIIYPLVAGKNADERDESDPSQAAVEEHARLQRDVFPHHQIGLLHGRLRPDEKDSVMADFRDGKSQILVSTSVVEVGVDVPNATVMVIEGANRFGLSQLHQFRGRVGRGQAQSYCLLIPEERDDAENERLQAMAASNDGFVLAEKDLEQRGPGDFLGTRQAGFSELKLASLTDVHLIESARKQAQVIFERDPLLEWDENAQLKAAMQRFWGEGDDASTGSGDIS